MQPFHSLLCPVDFSSCSRHALSTATSLATCFGAKLVVLHAWHPTVFSGPESTTSPDLIQTMIEDTDRALADSVASAKAAGVISVESRIIEGLAADAILKLVDVDGAFDLVVMGTHGRTGLAHLFLGSVAERVVRSARCAVLVVR